MSIQSIPSLSTTPTLAITATQFQSFATPAITVPFPSAYGQTQIPFAFPSGPNYAGRVLSTIGAAGAIPGQAQPTPVAGGGSAASPTPTPSSTGASGGGGNTFPVWAIATIAAIGGAGLIFIILGLVMCSKRRKSNPKYLKRLNEKPSFASSSSPSSSITKSNNPEKNNFFGISGIPPSTNPAPILANHLSYNSLDNPPQSQPRSFPTFPASAHPSAGPLRSHSRPDIRRGPSHALNEEEHRRNSFREYGSAREHDERKRVSSDRVRSSHEPLFHHPVRSGGPGGGVGEQRSRSAQNPNRSPSSDPHHPHHNPNPSQSQSQSQSKPTVIINHPRSIRVGETFARPAPAVHGHERRRSEGGMVLSRSYEGHLGTTRVGGGRRPLSQPRASMWENEGMSSRQAPSGNELGRGIGGPREMMQR